MRRVFSSHMGGFYNNLLVTKRFASIMPIEHRAPIQTPAIARFLPNCQYKEVPRELAACLYFLQRA